MRTRGARPPLRKAFGISALEGRAISRDGTGRTAGLLWSTNGSAEIHHRLDEITGALAWHHVQHQPFDLGSRGPLQASETGDQPLDVRVDGSDSLAERDRSDRSGRISADTRQLAKLTGARREAAASLHLASAGDQIAGSGVITKACPFAEDVLVLCCRERSDRRPALDETLEPWLDRRDARLLEHDFA